MLCCRDNIIGICVTQPKIARIISIASGVLWWQYATYASSCIMTNASNGYCCVHIFCAPFWRMFDSSHCLWLTEVSLPREVERLPLNCFQFYPSRLLSDDMSMVGWSLVKLASALLHLFHANSWKLLWYMLCCFQEEWLCLFILCIICLLYLVMSLILFRHLGGVTLFWVVRCLPIILLGNRAFICIFWSPKIHYVSCHWRIGGDGNRCSRQSPESPLVNLGILMASFYKHCC